MPFQEEEHLRQGTSIFIVIFQPAGNLVRFLVKRRNPRPQDVVKDDRLCLS